MWDVPLFAQFLFTLFPLVVIMIILVKIIRIISMSLSGNKIQFISLIPYIFIIYYIMTWMKKFGDEEALGYVNGTFKPTDVASQMTVSATFLMEEALPTCMALIVIWGMLSIFAYHFTTARGNSQ